MQQLIPYIIKLSISLSVVYLFYQLALRRLTFYNWNRWYLLFYSVAAFIIPFININPFLEKNDWQSSQMIEIIPAVGYQVSNTDLANESISWSVGNWTSVFILIGMAVMLSRFIIQHWSFRNIRSKSTLIIDDQVKVYQVNKEIIPFSFGNSIFINQHQHSEEELKEIIRHEFVHVKQKHSIDIIWGEMLCIINWYNPFAWLIRKSIRQNLEFIADNKVIENGLDKKQYQYMLLKVVGVSQYSIATQFNFSSLKKRIAMMNKIKSAKFHLVKFLFILPMLLVALLAFRNRIPEHKNQVWASGLIFDSETKLPLKDVNVNIYDEANTNASVSALTDNRGYYKIMLPKINSNTNIVFAYDQSLYKQSKYKMSFDHSSDDPLNSPVDFVFLAPKDGVRQARAKIMAQSYSGEPDYTAVFDMYKKYTKQVDLDIKITDLVKNSTKPIWIIEGAPYAIIDGAKAWFDKEELKDPDDFSVYYNGTLLTMDEANSSINRFHIENVNAASRETALKEFGIDRNLLILYPALPKTITDTAPGASKLPKEVKSISVQNDKVTVKLKNGKIEKYDLSKPEEEAAFDKKYGKILPPPPPPPPAPGSGTSAPKSGLDKPAPPIAPEEVTVIGYPRPPSAPAAPEEATVIGYGRSKKAPTVVEGHPLPPTAPNPPSPPVKNKKGNYISIADAEGDCIVIVRNKDRKIIKTITLEEWNQKETEYRNLYGDIPPASNPAPEEKLKGSGDNGIIQAPTSTPYQIPVEMKLTSKINASVGKTVNITTLNPDPNILYVLDGVKMTSESFELKNIDPNSIDNIQVLKGTSGEALYGAEGKRGVIVIVTKKFKAASAANNPITLRSDGGVHLEKIEDYKGLIIVNGIDYTSLQFKEMNIAPERIESVQVWKGEKAIEKFGVKAKDGAIEVTLKKMSY